MNLLSLRLSYETDISCSVLPAAFKKKKVHPRSFYFSVSSSGITQLHMIELSSFQGNILVTNPTRRDEDMPLCGESGAMQAIIIGSRNLSSVTF